MHTLHIVELNYFLVKHCLVVDHNEFTLSSWNHVYKTAQNSSRSVKGRDQETKGIIVKEPKLKAREGQE